MRKLSSGKCSGIKRPFKLEEIWRIRTRLEIENDLMQLALLNLAIDSKLRASDLLKHTFTMFLRKELFMKGFSASIKKRVPMSTMRLLREHSRVLADGSLQHP